jgi:hypothetical protein
MLDGNPEPDLVHATGCKQPTLRLYINAHGQIDLANNAMETFWHPLSIQPF